MCVIYVQLGCCPWNDQGQQLIGIGALEAARVALAEWDSRLICSYDCALPLNLIREELVTGTYCWLRGVTCAQVYSSKIIAEGNYIAEYRGAQNVTVPKW